MDDSSKEAGPNSADLISDPTQILQPELSKVSKEDRNKAEGQTFESFRVDRTEQARKAEAEELIEAAKKLHRNPLLAPEIAKRAILLSRQRRLATEEANRQERNWIQRRFSSGVGRVLATGVEMIPGGLGPWGLGDFFTLGSAVFGRDWSTGDRLDKTGRLISLAAAIIPVVPARPFVALANKIRRHGEDAVHAAHTRNQTDLAQNTKDAHGALKDMGRLLKRKKR